MPIKLATQRRSGIDAGGGSYVDVLPGTEDGTTLDDRPSTPDKTLNGGNWEALRSQVAIGLIFPFMQLFSAGGRPSCRDCVYNTPSIAHRVHLRKLITYATLRSGGVSLGVEFVQLRTTAARLQMSTGIVRVQMLQWMSLH